MWRELLASGRRTAPPTTKNYLASNINSAEVEKFAHQCVPKDKIAGAQQTVTLSFTAADQSVASCCCINSHSSPVMSAWLVFTNLLIFGAAPANLVVYSLLFLDHY